MPTGATSTYVPDALATLRDSFALHRDATRADGTAWIRLARSTRSPAEALPNRPGGAR